MLTIQEAHNRRNLGSARKNIISKPDLSADKLELKQNLITLKVRENICIRIYIAYKSANSQLPDNTRFNTGRRNYISSLNTRIIIYQQYQI